MTHSQARCVFTYIGYTGTPHPLPSTPPPLLRTYASISKVVVFYTREVWSQFYALFKKRKILKG
jgi:hypothetical protein